jgi:hypothetical protein
MMKGHFGFTIRSGDSRMRVRRAHRVLGLILLLPICGWAVTGFVFFTKPGYEAAYSALRVREYPLDGVSIPLSRPGWLEVRALRTVLGNHLLVRMEGGWAQLDPATLRSLELPDDSAIRRMVQDAIASDRTRYGEIASIIRDERDGSSISIATTTGVEIDLDWNTLALNQSGRDTRRIDALYRIHYLQWTGIRLLDRVLGIIGLASLVALAILGLRLAFGGRRS